MDHHVKLIIYIYFIYHINNTYHIYIYSGSSSAKSNIGNFGFINGETVSKSADHYILYAYIGYVFIAILLLMNIICGIMYCYRKLTQKYIKYRVV